MIDQPQDLGQPFGWSVAGDAVRPQEVQAAGVSKIRSESGGTEEDKFDCL